MITFTKGEDDYRCKVRYLVEIGYGDLSRMRLTTFDRALIQDCESSAKVSDKLLALETIVRRAEEAK